MIESAEFVRVNDDAVSRWADAVAPGQLRPAGHSLLAALPGNREQIANLVLLIDALNFCFWGPQPTYASNGATHRGFNAMLAAVIDAARREPRWFDARFWCDVSSSEFGAAVSPGGDLPMLAEREVIAPDRSDAARAVRRAVFRCRGVGEPPRVGPCGVTALFI